MSLVRLADVEQAQAGLSGLARVTPVEPCRPLTASLRRPVLLKCENLQRAGSFKVRGAYTRIVGLSDAERSRGVVAASAGNHAQGVALAAGACGTTATVYMPARAPLPKVAATQGYGATVELVGATVEEALAAAREHADRTGAVFIHPFDHPRVIAGQGTVGLEILEQCPDVSLVIVPVGGGGLVAGVAAAVKAIRPAVRVVGVQAAGAAAMLASLRAGHPVRLDSYATIADGIAVGSPGEVTFAHVRELVDEVVTVSDEDLSRALLMLWERAKLVVEPAGAAAVAAILSGAAGLDGAGPPAGPVVAVLSGGNIDPLLTRRVIEHGLTIAGRYLHLTVSCVDRPGQLAALLGAIAEQGANVVDVAHERHRPGLHIDEVEVNLSVETRGPEHSRTLVRILRAAGYRVPHPSIVE